MIARRKNSICRLHDIILRVNEMDFTQIDHQAAVDGLKAAGNHVHLVSSMYEKQKERIDLCLVNSSISTTSYGRNSTE